MMRAMKRRDVLLKPAAVTAFASFASRAAWADQVSAKPSDPAAAKTGLKVLRLASESETGFDPARVGDARSLRII